MIYNFLIIIISILSVNTFYYKKYYVFKKLLNINNDYNQNINNENIDNDKNEINNIINDIIFSLLSKDVEIISLETFDFEKKFFILVGYKTIKNDILLQKLKILGINAIFIQRNFYSKKDLYELYESEITDKSFLNKDLWVFDESKFIGSYYELYKIIINMYKKFKD